MKCPCLLHSNKNSLQYHHTYPQAGHGTKFTTEMFCKQYNPTSMFACSCERCDEKKCSGRNTRDLMETLSPVPSGRLSFE